MSEKTRTRTMILSKPGSWGNRPTIVMMNSSNSNYNNNHGNHQNNQQNSRGGELARKMTLSSLSCRLCGKPVMFDDKHVSQRTGRKIPLDIETNKPHDCPVWKRSNSQQQSQQQSQEQPRKLVIQFSEQ
jgi:hypothetical protein